MRLVMLGEEDLRPRDAELGRDDPLDPDLLAERVLHRVREARATSAETRAARVVRMRSNLSIGFS